MRQFVSPATEREEHARWAALSCRQDENDTTTPSIQGGQLASIATT
ncbi:unnamed protein product [Penicillium roqueforti FM164]|uniref:Genomic scaffold, ProqFM164S04 n=1 Tax=Penicillium roqueforti (strain FM164) TaxID=1365484 RepID=W6QPA3_PENRF|nr:unnamed protein product [Penicillium roqueforti FM164]